MPVEFLTDSQAAAYAAYDGAPSRTELERFFFLDDADRALIEPKRRAHNRLGFAAQLTTARYLGVFLDDPTGVPAEVADYLAEQLGIADASVLKTYGDRENTRLDHVRELRRVLEYTEFAEAEAELRAWVDARAWTTGEGPKALFDAAVGWLRERRVLLPGVTTLARLVASVREAANQRLWDTLYGLLSTGQRAVLDSLLTVPAGARISELDRLRGGPVRISGPQMNRALERAAEIATLGMGEVDVSGIPPRRLAELSRYGIDGKASLLRRHGDSRRLATLLATAVYLTTRAVDDALGLLEVLIATKLLARAERESAKEKLKSLPRVERASAKLAAAFQIVFDITSEQVDTDTGEITPPEVEPEPEPASLVELRAAVNAMLPRVDLPEALLEVFSWTGADAAFTSVTGGEARLKDLHVTIAALLVARGCNVGYAPVLGGVDALKYGRLSHVDQTYLRLATYRAANATLIEHQASIPLAQAWGGGLVASVDGMRFVVPVPSVYARPNPRYFGRRGGATWLNMINDQAAGLGGKVVAGTPRDSLYVLDVLYDRDGGRRPETIVTDTASYSDIVFGLLTLAGFAYAPQLADLPDQKMWRIDHVADYGAFQDAARGRVDLARIERHWEDILRIIGSIHTGAVRAYDVIRMLSRDARPTPLGDAIAHYGRIAKTLHILRLAEEPGYRRQIKSQANLQEGRHSLARKIFHGHSGQLYQRYQDGMEDQIGALGLILNALVLFNTRYMDAAVNHLRTDGFDVRDEDVARLSPFVRHHINMLGRYSFQLPDLPGGLRPLRDPDAADEQ